MVSSQLIPQSSPVSQPVPVGPQEPLSCQSLLGFVARSREDLFFPPKKKNDKSIKKDVVLTTLEPDTYHVFLIATWPWGI